MNFLSTLTLKMCQVRTYTFLVEEIFTIRFRRSNGVVYRCLYGKPENGGAYFKVSRQRQDVKA